MPCAPPPPFGSFSVEPSSIGTSSFSQTNVSGKSPVPTTHWILVRSPTLTSRAKPNGVIFGGTTNVRARNGNVQSFMCAVVVFFFFGKREGKILCAIFYRWCELSKFCVYNFNDAIYGKFRGCVNFLYGFCTSNYLLAIHTLVFVKEFNKISMVFSDSSVLSLSLFSTIKDK